MGILTWNLIILFFQFQIPKVLRIHRVKEE